MPPFIVPRWTGNAKVTPAAAKKEDDAKKVEQEPAPKAEKKSKKADKSASSEKSSTKKVEDKIEEDAS